MPTPTRDEIASCFLDSLPYPPYPLQEEAILTYFTTDRGVVVTEILLNRLLHPEEFQFEHVSAVVMDEFHSFADIERGIVWELSLSLLPPHIRLLLLSATVGNSLEFLAWLERSHGRKLDLVEGRDRRVPLDYRWVPDQLLPEQLVFMAKGDAASRKTPALVFCFNRDACWSVAEALKGLDLLPS